MLALLIPATWPVWSDIYRQAVSDESMSHILGVPFIAALLFYVRRHRFKELRPRGYWVGLLILLFGIGLYTGSYFLRREVLWHTSVAVMAIGVLVAAFGQDLLRRFAPALFALFFLIPPPPMVQRLAGVPLQNASAFMAGDILRLLRLNVVQSGSTLEVNGHMINVAEACAGLRSTIALILILYAYAFVFRRNWKVRAAMLIAAPLLAIPTNLARLIPTAYAHVYGSEATAQAVHDMLGFVMFFVALLICRAVEMLLIWARVRVHQGPWSSESVQPARVPATRWMYAAPALCVAILLTLLVQWRQSDIGSGVTAYHVQAAAAVARMPMTFEGWQGQVVDLAAPAIRLLKPNAYYSVRFTDQASRRSFSVSLIQTRYARDMAYHFPPVCYPASGWQLGQTREVRWRAQDGAIDGQEYQFWRIAGDGVYQIRVENFFIMPEGQTQATPGDMTDRNKAPWLDPWGATQVQFIFDGSFSSAERRSLVENFVAQVAPVIRILRGRHL